MFLVFLCTIEVAEKAHWLEDKNMEFTFRNVQFNLLLSFELCVKYISTGHFTHCLYTIDKYINKCISINKLYISIFVNV